MSKTLVRVNSITLSYDGVNVIENLSFEICEGDYLCIIGENGSGKSTLLNTILGLKRPTLGKIELCGIKRREIGVLPQQNPVSKDFPALVCEVVESGCLNRTKNGLFINKSAKKIAFENMERLGVTSIARHPYRDLSGGQRQRVALARALSAAEKMLILDEPVTSLDAKTTYDIYSLIHDLNRRHKMTVVTVTHDIDAALKNGTKILRINKDSVFFGTVDEYLRLDEAKAYVDADHKQNGDDIPFGEGGFRYMGGAK